MRKLIASLGSSALLLGGAVLATRQEQKGDRPPETTFLLRPATRFEGALKLRMRDGRQKELRVSLRDWSLVGEETAREFPEKGLVIVHLLAGRVTTIIGNKEQERADGDFWVVPAGMPMKIRVQGEMASLRTLVLPRP